MRPIVDNGPAGPTASLYVHLPFCRERCSYCSFPTVADEPALHAPLVDAVLAEARRVAAVPLVEAPLESLYLGGGTPGLIAAPLLGRLLGELKLIWAFQSDIELTLEVNPANVTEQSLEAWDALGVSRLSVGVQTFDDKALARLGRRHDAQRASAALRDIRRAWRWTWSADLLAGWSGQTLPALEGDLGRLLESGAPHISVYALTVEPGTPLAALQRAGRTVAISAALEPEFDSRCAQLLTGSDFERYEVSNYARAGHRSRHNQVYWADRSYLGLGPGAASSIHPHRWVNRPDLTGYIEAARTRRSLRVSAEAIHPLSRLVEVLGVGLRTADGVDRRDLDRRFGAGTAAAIGRAGRLIQSAGLLILTEPRIRIPGHALARADSIATELIVSSTDDESSSAGLLDIAARSNAS
ncbi:MAG TPA: radical SAM family heme chaperone HemW [Planctomycetota bacterium]|nr:radical SAM family heme chaperone HemW [Planctomycetota bacterium]